MDKDLEKTIEELELAGTPGEREVVSALMREGDALDTVKDNSIREALFERAAAPRLTGNLMKWNRLMYILPVGALAAIVLFIATQGRPGAGTPSSEPSRQVAIADKLGFGDLPALAPTVGAGQAAEFERAISSVAPTAPVAPTTAQATDVAMAAPAMMAGDASAENLGSAKAISATTPVLGLGGGGSASAGVAIMPAPAPVPCRGCGIELPPRIVYSFNGELPTIPSDIAVYRTRKPEYPSDAVARVLEPLGLRGFADISLQNLSFTDGDGMNWNFDSNSGYLYFNSDYGYRILADGTEAAKRGGTLTDDQAIAAANSFLSAHGIATAGYGDPEVGRQDFGYPCKGGMPCPMMETSAAASDAVVSSAPAPDVQVTPAIYPLPYGGGSVTVTYGAMRDGYSLLNWDGSGLPGISVTLDSATGKVTNGNVMLQVPADRSLYPAKSAEDILTEMRNGGLSPYYYYGDVGGGLYTPEEESRRKTVNATFSSARIGYVERYSDDGRTRYLLPVVGFRGTLKDQYGNVSDWGTIVPIVSSGGGSGTVTGSAVPTVPTTLPETSVPAR